VQRANQVSNYAKRLQENAQRVIRNLSGGVGSGQGSQRPGGSAGAGGGRGGARPQGGGAQGGGAPGGARGGAPGSEWYYLVKYLVYISIKFCSEITKLILNY